MVNIDDVIKLQHQYQELVEENIEKLEFALIKSEQKNEILTQQLEVLTRRILELEVAERKFQISIDKLHLNTKAAEQAAREYEASRYICIFNRFCFKRR